MVIRFPPQSDIGLYSMPAQHINDSGIIFSHVLYTPAGCRIPHPNISGSKNGGIPESVPRCSHQINLCKNYINVIIIVFIICFNLCIMLLMKFESKKILILQPYSLQLIVPISIREPSIHAQAVITLSQLECMQHYDKRMLFQ